MAHSSFLMLKFGIVVVMLVSGFTLSESAVSSIDLGSEWLKVAVVNLKPGQTPISIAINEMSKRKTPGLVAFHDGCRLVGEEAAGIVARYPEKVFSHLRDMVGKPCHYVRNLIDSIYLPYDLVEDHRGAANIKVEGGVSYTVEELLAMLLGYAAELAEFHSKVPMKDVVVSVPAYFGQAERRGLIQAAQLAGINVLSLVNEHSGAALQYGIDKDFSNSSKNVIFYDMGSRNTYATLVYYSAYTAKEFGKSVSINQFQVKDVRWDAELGGQDMESRLVEFFADEFNKQIGNAFDVRKSPKAMAKLKKQVKRTKEILSANTIAPISVESLYDDRDFRSTITREKFEELCNDLWARALKPLKEVLEFSGLKVEDIYAVELIGGATRVPKLQAKIQEFLGKNALDKHLDADEAIALGSSLHAANLTDGIKLNRKLGMIDGSTYGFMIELVGPDLLKNESARQLLVPRMKKLPSKMFRSIPHNKDFEVFLSYKPEDLLPPGVLSPIFSQYAISGLANTSDKYSSRNLTSPIRASLHFSLSRSGIISLDRADAVIEVSEWVEVPKRNLTVNNVLGNSTVENVTVTGEKSGNLNASMENESIASGANGDEPQNNDLSTEKRLKKKTFRIPLKVVETTTGPGMPLSNEYIAEATKKIEELKKKDEERKKTAELKNSLEEYIYSTKDKLETLEELKMVSTSDERKSFVEKLDEVQEWLYMDGEDATTSHFKKHLDTLKAIGDPIFFRYKELSARPVASELARKFFTELDQIVQDWESKKPWLPSDRIEEVRAEAEKFKSWLNEKEAAQKKLSGESTPVITSEEIYTKFFSLQDKVGSINKIPKPKPKVVKKPKNETEPKSENTTASEKKEAETSEDKDSIKLEETLTGETESVTKQETDPHDEL